MKKLLILSLTLFVCLGTFSSCTKKCRGGGWYGNRNLGYVPQEKKADEAAEVATIYMEEENCEETVD